MVTNSEFPVNPTHTTAVDLLQDIQELGLKTATARGIHLSPEPSQDERDAMLGAILLGALIDTEVTGAEIAQIINQCDEGQIKSESPLVVDATEGSRG